MVRPAGVGRRYGRPVRRILLAVLVLVAVVLAADRVSVPITERAIADRVTEHADVQDVSVTTGGFPFLTQLARRDLDAVTMRAASGTFGGVRATDITVRADHLSLRAPYHVRSGVADVVVPTSSLQEALKDRSPVPVELTAEQDGLQATVSVLGADVSLVLAPAPAQDGRSITVSVVRASIGGASVATDDLPAALQSLVQGLEIPLDLPDGVRLTGVGMVPAQGSGGGVRVTASGEDVTLDDLAGAADAGGS